jgi:SAM-dependent methyltransferase
VVSRRTTRSIVTPVLYDADYEDSQADSPYFRAFAERVIDELIQRHGLSGKRVLEIGCGAGDFLRVYCERSAGTGLGLDPAAVREAGVHGAVEIRAEPFGPGSGHADADVVLCRHTLEHIPDVARFLMAIRSEFDDRPDTILYLEVPDTERIANEGAFWDIYYEHCSYFDRTTLCDLLRRTGWDPLECRLDYGDQYIVTHARAAAPIDEVRRQSPIMDFSPVREALFRWRGWADGLADRNARPAIWAASSKAVGFLAGVPSFEPVVATDINSAKWGRHLPGSGLSICPPSDLASFEIDTVLVMNPVYLDEIRDQLDTLGLRPRIESLGT